MLLTKHGLGRDIRTLQGMTKTMLVADIGGTNARFGLIDDQSGVRAFSQKTLSNDDFASAADLLDAYLTNLPEKPEAACLAIAGPVDNGRVQMTNRGWAFDCSDLSRQLGVKVFALNDFAAMANCAPYLTEADTFTVRSGQAQDDQPLAILGPGTGFGCAALIPSASGWLTLPSEGGHAAIGCETDLERQVVSILAAQGDHISVEWLLCGAGMERLHSALAQVNGGDAVTYSAADITHAAIHQTDKLAEQTVTVFCEWLASVAGDKALTYGARGGVFLAGGILPRWKGLIEKTRFAERFASKGVMSDYLASVPVRVIDTENPALIGAAAWLKAHLKNF